MGRCNSGKKSSRRRWHPFEIVAIVLGFIVFWPIGLALLFWKLWGPKQGAWAFPSDPIARLREGSLFGMPATGNTAFDDYKRATLQRLEEERRKLMEEEQAFADFLDELRRTRDRETFDRFMAARAAPQAG